MIKKEEKKWKLDPKRKLIEIDGTWYRTEKDEHDMLILTKVDKKKYDKIIGEVCDEIMSKIDKETILKDALYDLDFETLKGIHTRLLKTKRKPSIKVRDGCLEMKIGKFMLPLR